MNNIAWSKHIMSALRASGVRYLCLAPGSRSSPLVAAAAESDLEILVHFDERGLGFFALGLSKVRREPVVLLVTSGTAVGNLVPAIMEASHDDIPLIILSADRPPELRDCGANQTTDQVKLFGSFVRWQVDLACAETGLLSYLSSTVCHAVSLAKKRKGPVQINCMLREPLLGGTAIETPGEHGCLSEEGTSQFWQERIEEIAYSLCDVEEGLVILGQDAPYEAISVAEALQWPLITDVTSSLRGRSSCEIRYYEHLLKSFPPKAPQAILQFGRRLTSKTLMEFIKKSRPKPYYQVDHSFARFDPQHLVTRRFDVEPGPFARSLAKAIPQQSQRPWLRLWQHLSAPIAEKIESVLQNSYSEPGVALALTQRARKSVFLANSMPIRDMEAFFFPKFHSSPVYVNRGLSGIDGNIATCAGIAYASEAPLIATIGDLAFLHDLNSLATLQDASLPILFIVINNQGGGIFSFLPHLSQTAYFDRMVAYAHEYRFKAAAELFNIPYVAPTSHQEFISCLQQFENLPKMAILELTTKRDENLAFHRAIEENVKTIEVRQ